MIYLISDTHFGHENIKRYCNRPDNFEKLILKNLKKIKKGVIIHLGDFCFRDVVGWHRKFFEAVKVPAWLIRGNHDRNTVQHYLSMGWSFVGDSFTFSAKRAFGRKIIFTHRPMESVPEDTLNIHGHMHYLIDHVNYKGGSQVSDQHRLVSIELEKYKTITLSKILGGIE